MMVDFHLAASVFWYGILAMMLARCHSLRAHFRTEPLLIVLVTLGLMSLCCENAYYHGHFTYGRVLHCHIFVA